MDELLARLDNASGDLERLRDEKDQEIAIMEESLDGTIQQLQDEKLVRLAYLASMTLTDTSHAEGQGWRGDHRHAYP